MRNVLLNAFKRSTLSFMSLVLMLSTLLPALSNQAVGAATAPLSAGVACVDEKAVLTVTTRQANLMQEGLPANAENWTPFLGLPNVKYVTDFGTKSQTLTAGDEDYYVLSTGFTEILAGSVSATVKGIYSTKEVKYIWFIPVIYDKWHSYEKTLTANYDAKNCDETPPVVPANLEWTANGGVAQTTGGLTNSNTGTLSWVDTDADTDHYNYYFWTDIPGFHEGETNAWSTTDSSYFSGASIWTDFNEKEGTFFFCVKAVDENDNESACSDVYSVTYDKTAPVVAINNHTFAANIVTPEVTTTDKSGIKSYLWTPTAGADAHITVDSINIAEPKFTINTYGTYRYNLTVTDNANNETTVPFEFTFKKPIVKETVVKVSGDSSQPSAVSVVVSQPAAIFGINKDFAVTEEKVAAIGTASRDTAGDVAGTADEKVGKGCGIFLGICWYYWIPIVIAILAVAYAVRRRLQTDQA